MIVDRLPRAATMPPPGGFFIPAKYLNTIKGLMNYKNLPPDLEAKFRAMAASRGVSLNTLTTLAIKRLVTAQDLWPASLYFQPCVIADKSATIIEVNELFCFVLGYDEEELIGRGFTTIQSNRGQERSKELILEWGAAFNNHPNPGVYAISNKSTWFQHRNGHELKYTTFTQVRVNGNGEQRAIINLGLYSDWLDLSHFR